MLYADLHIHTKYSHGNNTPAEMYAKACSLGLRLVGFTEHSPRPKGFDYTHEYRDALTAMLPTYVREVCALRDNPQKGANQEICQVLFGMEMDWLEDEEDFARASAKAFDFDYLLGSVHFIGHWGFDDGVDPWLTASQEQCETWYEDYFTAWEAMICSGLYAIAAHPDLIKIFSVDQFHIWLQKPQAQAQVGHALDCLRKQGMAMEISSAGLRKRCHEIYPCEAIMAMAASREIPITFASDAHGVNDIAYGFDILERYAARFGYREHCAFQHGKTRTFPFGE
ncbi:MAG: histidinol-phosphatase [Desulfovibrio sp.]|nr:histidinol-phosphatase [Desulfovibrio sp.]